MAERALYYWNNEYIVNLMGENIHAILPIVYPALYINANGHWNRQIHNLAYNALKLLMEINGEAFEQCAAEFKRQRLQEKGKQAEREQRWRQLRDSALRNVDASGRPAPKSLTHESVVPEGTFNPRADEMFPDDSSSYDLSMDDQQQQQSHHDQMTGGTGLPPAPYDVSDEGGIYDPTGGGGGGGGGGGDGMMDADDVEAQLGPAGGTSLQERVPPSHQYAANPAAPRFPGAAAAAAPPPAASSPTSAAAAAGGAAHIRRKSVIPIDQSVLRELASHKSLDDGPLIGSQQSQQQRSFSGPR